MKAVVVHQKRSGTILSIEEVETPSMQPDEVLVNIHATALNRADLIQREGRYPPPPGASEILGLEMAGEITEVGSDVDQWQIGDRVFALLPGGGYAQYAAVPAEMLLPIPDEMSYQEAAAIPETFLTAYQTLVWLGDLKAGHRVLIHAGGSGVGTSAIQLAREMGATIYTTAGQDHKLERCAALGADLTINYKTEDFDQQIAKATKDDGVDLIIDFIGEPYWEQNLKTLKIDGRMIYLAMMGGSRLQGQSIGKILTKRLTIKGSTLRSRPLDYKTRLTKEFWSFAEQRFKNQQLKPVMDSVYSWKKVEEAHDRMGSNLNTGKIVLTID
ncbi:MAG: NAD(P)H-quinone oxidoreductase [Bacteroidota bacterium]